MKTHKRNTGFALIAVLLFTAVISFLVLSILQTSGLENKMLSAVRVKNLALIAAENTLQRAEQSLRIGGVMPKNAYSSLISDRTCGVVFYRITAVGKFGLRYATLQSTFAKLDLKAKCKEIYIIQEGRKSWREIEQ